MKKKTWKILFKCIVYAAVFGIFAGLILYLNTASQTSEEEETLWIPEKAEGIREGWEKAAENEYLELYFEPSLVQIIVKDKKTGTQWRSNPEDAAEDPIAFGQNKTLVQSLLDISYVDDQSNYFTINSFAGSVQNMTYAYAYQDDGVSISFGFGKQGFEIPCFFGLQGDHFVARVLSEEIRQHGKLQIASVTLLPYFGAGSLEDEGYMVVPDGSGALIYYNNQKQSYQSYSQKVYGRNLALHLQSTTLVTQDATMPVWGIRKNDDALLAVITQGEYQAEIRAEVGRKITGNNAVYSDVLFIQSENNTLLEGSDKEETAVMISPQHNHFPYYEVSYYFLEKGAGYSEMAARYRQYLMEEKGMQETDGNQKRLGLTFLGGVVVRKTMLGIPYHAVEALSTFKAVGETAAALEQEIGNSFLISMYDTEKGGTQNKIPTKLTYDSALGGKSGYQKMADALEEMGIPFYPVYNPVAIRKSGNGYRSTSGVRNVARSAAAQYDYKLTTGAKDTDLRPYYLVSPKYIEDILSSLSADAQKKGVTGLGLSGIGNSVYADYRSESISQNETGQYWENALGDISGSVDTLLLQGAYAYAFPYADVITEVPLYASQFDVEDESIPFYEMVVGGCAALYSEPVNRSGNVREMILKCVEYGVSPNFLLMTGKADLLQDTDYQKYYAVAYESWQDTIRELSEELRKLDGVRGQRMTGHRKVQEQVYATVYEDGTVVYVNYSDQAVTVENVTIPAMGFIRKGAK